MPGFRTLIIAAAGFMLLLPGGCPIDATTPGINLPAFSASGGTGGGSAGSTSGAGATGSSNNPGSDGSVNTAGTSGVGPGAAVSGTTAGVASPDTLTIKYPACDEPLQGAFWRQEVLRLVNQERQNGGLSPVTWSDTLAGETADYACQMVQYNFFDHVSPVTGSTLRDRTNAVNYDFWIVGENLAAGQRTPVEVVTAWMQSPCHRENIMNPAFTELGIAVRYGGTYGYYWVQEFGRPYSIGAYPGGAYHDPQCTHNE